MTKKFYTPRWLDLCDEIANSIGILNGDISDRKTINVLNNVIRTLMNKQALPDRLAATFLECIRRRTAHTNFAYSGLIKLTANQIKYAKRHGRDQIIPMPAPQAISSTFQPMDEKDELLAAFQRHFVHISSCIQPDFIQLSSILGSRTAELLGSWWRNEMELTEINHDGSMICPQDGMRLAGSPDVDDFANDRHEHAALPRHSMMSHEPAAAGSPQARTIIENHGGCGGAVKPAPRPAKSRKLVLSYFHNNRSKEPSAVLEYEGKRFSLVFTTVDKADPKIYANSTAEWRNALEISGLVSLRSQCRDFEKADSIRRFMMSPFYGEGDTFGKASAAFRHNAVAFLFHDDSGQPESILVQDGYLEVTVPLKSVASAHAKGPLFKGSAIMPTPDVPMAA